MLGGFSPREKKSRKGDRDVEEDSKFRKVGPRRPHEESEV